VALPGGRKLASRIIDCRRTAQIRTNVQRRRGNASVLDGPSSTGYRTWIPRRSFGLMTESRSMECPLRMCLLGGRIGAIFRKHQREGVTNDGALRIAGQGERVP
jgi:hypothetical protein